MRRYAEPFIHLVFWFLLGYLAYNNLGTKLITIKGPLGEVRQFQQPQFDQVFLLLVDLFFKAVLFYWTVSILIREYLTNRTRTNLLKLVAVFAGTFLLSYLLNMLIMASFEERPPFRATRLFSLSILLHFFIMLLAVAYGLSRERFNAERLQKEIKAEKLKTELDFLKSQLNPHFLFNTLNNLFAEANKHENPTLSSGIAKLSQMMRYMLYESNESFVSLEKEINYLHSFIELQMLRVSPKDPFDQQLDIDDYDPTLKIAPLLFQPLVENAFKHGISLESKSVVSISLSTHGEQLRFSIKNNKSSDPRQIEHSGIGLANLKRRLTLIYPEAHSLETNENLKEFSALLKLDLDKAKR